MIDDLGPSVIAGLGMGFALTASLVLHGWPLYVALWLIASVAISPIVGGFLKGGNAA